MILIITHKEDYTADIVVNMLNERKIEYVRYNTEDLILENDISISVESEELSILIRNKKKFKSVWFRRVKLPELNEKETSKANYIYSQFHSFFHNLWEVIDSKWMSLPYFVYRAENKMLQLNEARNIGLKIPNTLVSSNANGIKDFYYSNSENIIIKPLFSSPYYEGSTKKLIFTNKILYEHIENLDSYLPIPTIFQEYIDKDIEIRATVVDNQVFAACVDSQNNQNTQVDWRKEKIKFQKYKLPNHIENQLIALTKGLGLKFGAIDIILDKNGNYVFLEINPNGQWGWIEIDTQLPISDAIIQFLN